MLHEIVCGIFLVLLTDVHCHGNRDTLPPQPTADDDTDNVRPVADPKGN